MPRKDTAKELRMLAKAKGQQTLFVSVSSTLPRPAAAGPERAPSTPVAFDVDAQRDVSTQCNFAPVVSTETGNEDSYLGELLRTILDGWIHRVEAQAKADATERNRKKSRKKRLEEGLVEKRRTYDKYERSIIKKKSSECGMSTMQFVKSVRKTSGYDSFSKSTLKRMLKENVSRKRGRKVNLAYDEAVMDNLVFSVLEKIDGVETAVIQANIIHSHDIIRKAATVARKIEPFLSDEKVQKLKFTRTWIKGFLKRNTLRRRRTTTCAKAVPSQEQVRERMGAIQKTIVDGGYAPDQVHSSDETGMIWGAGPKHQYIPDTADRASTPPGDEKSRFTSLETGDGSGFMVPSFHVIKCSSKTPKDLSRTRVVHNLHALAGFTAAEGWALREWTKTLTINDKKHGPRPVTFKRPYLIHLEKLTVVTCQVKAWMDTAGVAMWVELQYGPYVARSCRGKSCLVWDNCSCHNVQCLKDIFAAWNIEVENLPPNMTDQLQVMDLVVNAPLKAGIRRMRCNSLFEEFQRFKIKRLTELAKPPAQRKLPKWNPPKPKLVDGLRTVIEVEETTLCTPKFRESMRRCFIAVGLIAKPESNEFARFVAVKAGFLSKLHEQAHTEADAPVDSFCLGDEVTRLDMVRPPADAAAREADTGDGSDDEESMGDDSSDDDESMEDADE